MLRIQDIPASVLQSLLSHYGLVMHRSEPGQAIPGSYWGAPEAGLVGHGIHVRDDTPLHSFLHETSHVICMDASRRATLHTDAGGDYAEEDAVCYLQIVLARSLGIDAGTLCADMDTWGYTFRLGSALRWFTEDAAEARDWLVRHGLLNADDSPSFRIRAA